MQASKDNLIKFIDEFFDQNPISQLAVIATRDRTAEKVSDLSGSKKGHSKPIKDLINTKGAASLQSTIYLALNVLKHVPEYGHKELLIVFSSLRTCTTDCMIDCICK